MTPLTALVPREPLTLAGAELRASYRRSRLYDAFCFFREHAGYCNGFKAAGALTMAKAEEWARAQRSAGLLRIGWEDDPEPGGPGDWCGCDEPGCRYCHGDGPESVECCLVEFRRPDSLDADGRCANCERDPDDCDCRGKLTWQTGAALCRIMDADADYRRVVEAELASEAMATV